MNRLSRKIFTILFLIGITTLFSSCEILMDLADAQLNPGQIEIENVTSEYCYIERVYCKKTYADKWDLTWVGENKSDQNDCCFEIPAGTYEVKITAIVPGTFSKKTYVFAPKDGIRNNFVVESGRRTVILFDGRKCTLEEDE